MSIEILHLEGGYFGMYMLLIYALGPKVSVRGEARHCGLEMVILWRCVWKALGLVQIELNTSRVVASQSCETERRIKYVLAVTSVLPESSSS